MTVKRWAILLVFVFALTAMAAVAFVQIHVELWDMSMNSIMITRDQFATMNRRGLALLILLPLLAGLTVKTLCELDKEPHKYPPIKEDDSI